LIQRGKLRRDRKGQNIDNEKKRERESARNKTVVDI
jgi:hypothetical protein